jgi:hypothetical protein
MIIFGFGNKARNGKDTAAAGVYEYCKQNGILCTRVGFADALKAEFTAAMARNAGDVQLLLANGPEPGIAFPESVKADPNPDMNDLRCPFGKHSEILQWWGTEYRRRWNPNYWTDKYCSTVGNLDAQVVVTPDMRFVNEAIAITEMGGRTVNVRRLTEEGEQYLDKSRPAGHASETELDGWNYDYRIIAKSGQMSLVKAYAVEILKHQLRLEKRRIN